MPISKLAGHDNPRKINQWDISIFVWRPMRGSLFSSSFQLSRFCKRRVRLGERRRAKALILFGKKLVLAFSVIAQENLSISPLGLKTCKEKKSSLCFVHSSTNTQKLLMKHFMLESHLSHFSVVSNTKDLGNSLNVIHSSFLYFPWTIHSSFYCQY